MGRDSVIQIEVLRKVINGILDFIEKDLASREVELGKDHYWEVLDRYLLEMPRFATQLGAGSLVDDCESLLSAAKQCPAIRVRARSPNAEHVQPIANQLTEVTPLLRRLGEVLGAKLAREGG